MSSEEAIQRLKAEIIAQDWRLSQKRADALEAAFACLKERFSERKATQALLFMAGSVVGYIKKRGDVLPAAIDFLKEAMAHVVSLYEDLDFDVAKEEKIFNSLFQKFNKLKTTIKAQAVVEVGAEGAGGGRGAGAAVDAAFVAGPGWPEEGRGAALPAAATPAEIRDLLAELHGALARAEEVGQVIRQLIQTLEVLPAAASLPPAAPLPAAAALLPASAVPPPAASPPPLSFTPVAVRQVLFGELRVLVAEEAIALLRPLGPETLQLYVKNGNVPLREFASFMRGLSRQFKGGLAAIKDHHLKKLSLPVMTPCGLGLPEVPDEQATLLLVVGDGDWHGVLLGCEGGAASEPMVNFRPEPNGDIAGVGFLENGVQLPFLDVKFILRREGFLVMA